MKYCTNCGRELMDEWNVCPNCGGTVGAAPVAARKETGLTTAAKVFMILGTIAAGWCLIPLAWCIPMTVYYFRTVKEGRKASTAFKICSLLFVSLIGGIIMLCDTDN